MALLLSACGSSPAPAAVRVGCGSSPPYAGKRQGDCVATAAHHFVIALAGYEVLVGNWKRATDDRGQRLICAGVNVENVSHTPESVSASQFQLVDPQGRLPPPRPPLSNALPTRRLQPAQQEGGTICWSDPGSGGQYAGTFSPSPVGERGVWLISFLPAAGVATS